MLFFVENETASINPAMTFAYGFSGKTYLLVKMQAVHPDAQRSRSLVKLNLWINVEFIGTEGSDEPIPDRCDQ